MDRGAIDRQNADAGVPAPARVERDAAPRFRMVLFSTNESSLAPLTHIYNYIHRVSPLVTISPTPCRRLVPRSSASLAVPLPVEFTVSGFGEVENHRMSRTGKGGKERFRSGPRDSGPDSGRCARSSSILQVCTTTLPSTTLVRPQIVER
jgi:hypothetical protein